MSLSPEVGHRRSPWPQPAGACTLRHDAQIRLPMVNTGRRRRTTASWGLTAAVFLAVVASPSQATSLTPNFVATWNAAAKDYRAGKFAQAHSKLAPVVSDGLALDDVPHRVWFIHDAAGISYMAGKFTEAQDYATRGMDSITPEERQAYLTSDWNPVLGDIVEFEAGPGESFFFETDSEFVNTSGQLVDRNGNGRLDDVTPGDIGGGVFTGLSFKYVDLNGNGSLDPATTEIRRQRVALSKSLSSIRVGRHGRITVNVTCKVTFGCAGIIKLVAAGRTIAVARGADYGRPTALKLTSAGQRLVAHGAIHARLLVFAGRTDRPAIKRKVTVRG